MKQILVATDFSNCASNAMEYAVELANKLKVEIVAIHAIGTTEGINNNVYSAIFIEDYYKTKRESLEKWANIFVSKEEYKDVKVSTTCDVGSVIKVITKYIDANPVELLVMGTMGATGIKDLFGHNASMMVNNTTTPTLIIPAETKFSGNPVITLSTDYEVSLSSEDIAALNDLITAFKSEKLTILNVIDTKQAWKTNEAGENSIKELIKNTELDFKYIQEDDVTDGIVNYIKSSNTDILCLVKHQHNMIYRIFNHSTVKEVINNPIKAVLVLHE
jgi:nucleotide-binding universal stress UspA family protein